HHAGGRHYLGVWIATRRHAPLAGAGAGPADRQVAGRRAVTVLPMPARRVGGDVAGRRRRLVAHQVRAPERVPAPPTVPGRIAVTGVGAVEGRAVASHDIDVVRDTAVPVGPAPGPAPVDPQIDHRAGGIVGIE